MSTTSITRYEIITHHELEDFVEATHRIQFRYNSRHLIMAGLHPDEIYEAIVRAMKVCTINHVDTTDHFRILYVFNHEKGGLYTDWQMTREGFMLVVINTPVSNDAIAQWQWNLVNRMS
jgi:hypothetical protein